MHFSIFCGDPFYARPLTKTGQTNHVAHDKERVSRWQTIIWAMKLLALLQLIFIMQLSAKTVSQTITLKASDISLTEILSAVEKQTGFVAVYERSIFPGSRRVDVHATNQPLRQFLSDIFSGSSLKFSIENTSIIITAVPSVFNPGEEHHKPPFHGIVQDKDNRRLAGVNIIVKGTKRGTVSGLDGLFTIDVQATDVLVLSSIGYVTQEVKAFTDGPIYITMQTSPSPLDEVQIIAYGSTIKRLNTGSVGTVKREVIERQPVANPLLALTGRVSGLDITQTGGVAGSGVKVRIRGQNSIRPEANDPLYIIDGVPFLPNSLDLGNISATILGYSGVGGVSPFNSLNPADIESIEVLKDADATAIYGSRGANGVILITTKRGKSGKTTVDANLSSGVGKITRFLDVLDRRDYLDMRYEAFRNDGEDFASDFANAPDLKVWDTTRNADWQEELIGGSAKYTNLQASVSGGNSQTTFMVGGGYWKETSVFPGKFSDEKISGRFNVGHTSTDRKFSLQFSSSFVHDNNQLPTTDPTLNALTLPPVAPAPFKEDGNLNWENSTWWNNPYSALRTQVTGITTNLVSNVRLQYQVFKPVSIAVNGGYNRLAFDGTVLYPYSAGNPDWGPPTGLFARTASFTATNASTWNVEPVIEYKSKAGPGTLNILAGTTFQRTYRETDNLQVYGIPDDALLKNPAAGTEFRPSRSASLYLYNAVFGRINYDLNNKYIINLTARRDGSSRFGPGRQFGNFGAVGAAWIFSNETFVEKALPHLSFGKIRASYGLIGSDNILEYQYVTSYVNSGQYSNVIYDGQSGLIPRNHANRNFGWESTRKFDLALETGWINDRVLLNVNYFRNESSNQLVGYVLPYITGFTSVQYNLPATVRNTGLELELNTVNVQQGNFTWKTSLNVTIPRNTLVSYPNLASSSYRFTYVEGKPLTIFKVWDLVRLDTETGLYVYRGDNKEETKTPMNSLRDEDMYEVVDLSRRLYGGFGNTFTYKRLSVDIFFQFVKQKGSLQKPIYVGYAENIPTYLWDNHWQKPGDLVGPKLTQAYGETYLNSSFGYDRSFYADASFIRLKNVLISYSIPGWIKKGDTRQNLKVYLTGQNLLTITPYKGLDPETTSLGLPPLTVVMAGVQLTL